MSPPSGGSPRFAHCSSRSGGSGWAAAASGPGFGGDSRSSLRKITPALTGCGPASRSSVEPITAGPYWTLLSQRTGPSKRTEKPSRVVWPAWILMAEVQAGSLTGCSKRRIAPASPERIIGSLRMSGCRSWYVPLARRTRPNRFAKSLRSSPGLAVTLDEPRADDAQGGVRGSARELGERVPAVRELEPQESPRRPLRCGREGSTGRPWCGRRLAETPTGSCSPSRHRPLRPSALQAQAASTELLIVAATTGTSGSSSSFTWMSPLPTTAFPVWPSHCAFNGRRVSRRSDAGFAARDSGRRPGRIPWLYRPCRWRRPRKGVSFWPARLRSGWK